MKRIAYICADPGIPVFGTKGGSIHVQEVLRQLLRRGHEVTLFARNLRGERTSEFCDLRCVPLTSLPRDRGMVRERAAIDSNADIRAELGRNGPFDLVYERHSLWTDAAMRYARESGVTGLLEVNAPLVEEQRRFRSLHLQDDAERLAHSALTNADAVLAVSHDLADLLQRATPEIRAVHVVSNGVDPDRFESCLGCPTEDATFTIGFVGTLKPWHGLDDLLAGFIDLRGRRDGVRLLIVGDGPMREPIIEQAQAHGLSDVVECTGAVPPGAIADLLSRMHVAVAPYPDLAGFYFSPLKIYEYMAAGRAVVASAKGQIEQVIRSGETGILYPPGDVESLADALCVLIDDPALRTRLGRAARADVVRHHRWEQVVDHILEIAARYDDRAVRAVS